MKSKISSKKMSVCVPTYERVDMVRKLIYSFIRQDYKNKELILSDDSKTDSIKNLVETEFKNNLEIKYFHNKENLGYSLNFLKSIERATGDYIIILGDDDAFLTESAITAYVDAFNSNPKVSYIYSNQIQFSNELKIEYIFDIFKDDMYFKKGGESIKNIWLTSVFIPGIGLRNDINFKKYYPTEDKLFPQLELIGHILNIRDSFFIKDYLIAGRAHKDQLGFMAIQNKLIKGKERHGTIEIVDIFKYLKSIYDIEISPSYFEKKLVNLYSTMILKEKMITNNQLIALNYKNFITTSKIAYKSYKLKLMYNIALISPKWFLYILKYLYNSFNKFNKFNKFLYLQKKLNNILTK
jgi:glycosyltransferase involved in cell wall biosynthesis